MEEDGLSLAFSALSPTPSSFGLALQSQQQNQQLQLQLQPQPQLQQQSSSSSSVLPSSSSSLSLASSLSASASASASDHVLRGRTTRQRNTRRRTKLSSQEREKILEVRRQRACLRCKMLKIQCSKENPCKPCLSSAVRGYERKVLSFCYCVRTRFVDVDIFQRSKPRLPCLHFDFVLLTK